ncbi:MBL fold metallo-hydrolase [Herbaspirillum sp. RTI4]|uniref:MBL fold metallo-hydrolase n=1 Tax=Herbaspirillum sp. RTI4 TaxID=3048640 RepID=UPI002AB59229|nr:MBL fold metallo-hydrolase [Herbaspirillum sp. RTI4]MDY7577420.1 MBL fold metallo-hydrolase [Herbaspirillum sp. RTI4]MEA9981696.1 MBL fold metallo-hydrolase [Herbaspirillum sp. RTI4]
MTQHKQHNQANPFRLPAGMHVFERGWLSSNNILLIDHDDTALVDSGYVAHAPQTLALVQHTLQERPLRRLLNTHLHSDHCGGNAALQAAYGCHTSIPLPETERVRSWDEGALSFAATGQQCPRFTVDGALQAGATVQLGGLDWLLLGSPGHDPHSLMFYCEQEAILISADALWHNGFGVIFSELEGEPGFDAAHATLELIAGLNVRLVIPGHGALFEDVDAALERAFSRLTYLAADPLRNAQYAVKVLLKFLLLERQAIPLATLPAVLGGIRLIGDANRRYLHLSEQELAEWVVAQLLKSGAASISNGLLCNAG